MLDPLLPHFIALPVMLALYVALLYALSRASFARFEQLANRYPMTAATARPKVWISISPTFGRLQGTRNGMKLSADPRGLYLDVIWMLRFGIRPAFIPWNKICFKSGERWKFFKTQILTFENEPQLTLTLSLRDWNRAARKFAEYWPGAHDE